MFMKAVANKNASEIHPYGFFMPKKPKAMLVGSFPIAKFTNPKRRKEIKPNEYDFFFGGEKNLLWKLLADCFGRKISTKDDIIDLLESEGIAIGDVIQECKRRNGGSSDSSLYDIKWNENLIQIIRRNNIHIIYFTSKSVESWFNRLFEDTDDLVKISLISPSGQSVRSIGSNPKYRLWKKVNQNKKAYDFILENYKGFFGISKANLKKKRTKKKV